MKSKAFTLAELLIALAILGVIATFTIPKILTAQTNSKHQAMAKEVASMVSHAYQLYQSDYSISASTKPSDLTPYMNYVSVDTTSIIDASYPTGTVGCIVTEPCLMLHNGGKLYFQDNKTFGGTSVLNAIAFKFDPDGTVSAIKSIEFLLYANGGLTTRDNFKPGSLNSVGTFSPCGIPACDPPWFSWN